MFAFLFVPSAQIPYSLVRSSVHLPIFSILTEGVRRHVREAARKRQLIVFLVVDNVAPTSTTPASTSGGMGGAATTARAPGAAAAGGSGSNSIFDIKSVSFVNGKMKMESYMDSFPFPYYIVLRDVSALPDVLGDALCQWFDMMRVAEL